MWISLALLLPVFTAALIPLAGLAPRSSQSRIRRVVSIAAPVTTIPAVAMTLWGADSQLSLDWVLTGVTLVVDDVARALVLIGALLYGAALMAVSWKKIRSNESVSGALTAFLLASYTGNIGVYLAADAVSFYLFFAIMSFSAAGLVVHYRTGAAYRATRIYLVMTVISETALLAGLIFTVQAGGKLLTDAPEAVLDSSRTGLILTLLLIGFGIKAGTMPLHVWLPLAHPAAPPAASAVLSGAMVKAGMVGFLRFFPLQESGAALNPTIELFGTILMILSLLGAFVAVGVGAIQRDAKVILAYSTISQMGFIGAIIAAGLLDGQLAEDTIDAAVLYAVHHGLAKGALFLGVPVIKHYGRGAAGLVVTIGMVGAGLAVAGAPITSGGIGKYVSKDAVEGLTVAGIDLYNLLPFVATGSTILLLRFLWVVLGEERKPHTTFDGELAGWLAVCLAGIVAPWLIAAYWSPLHLPEWTDLTTVWDSAWPIGLGVVIGVGCWLAYRIGWIPASTRDEPLIPAGDLVVVEERLVRQIVAEGGHVLEKIHAGTTRAREHGAKTGTALAERVRDSTDRIETTQRPWPRFGTVAVIVLTLVIVVSFMVAGGNR